MAAPNGTTHMPYDTVVESRNVFSALLSDPKLALPPAITSQRPHVHIHGVGAMPTMPTPWRETEAITATKALEACIALALAELRFTSSRHTTSSNSTAEAPQAPIDTDHATLALFMSYLSTVNGFGKWNKRSFPFLKPTDIDQAQWNLYRRLSANIYKTKREGEYYHTHGSLEATPILNAVDLPGFLKDSEDEGLRTLKENYKGICKLIQERTQEYSAEESEQMTVRLRQAGAVVYREEDFLRTEQGRALSEELAISVKNVEAGSQPAGFEVEGERNGSVGEESQLKSWLLKGIKVLDLTRVIAGPSISRTLGCSTILAWLVATWKQRKSLQVAKSGASNPSRRQCSLAMVPSRGVSPLRAKSLYISPRFSLRLRIRTDLSLDRERDHLSKHAAFQRRVLISLPSLRAYDCPNSCLSPCGPPSSIR
jgi:hypothetical protein